MAMIVCSENESEVQDRSEAGGLKRDDGEVNSIKRGHHKKGYGRPGKRAGSTLQGRHGKNVARVTASSNVVPHCDVSGPGIVQGSETPTEAQPYLPSPPQTDSSSSVSAPQTPSPVTNGEGSMDGVSLLPPPHDSISPPRYKTVVRGRPLVFRRNTHPTVRGNTQVGRSHVKSGRVSKKGTQRSARQILNRIRGEVGRSNSISLAQMQQIIAAGTGAALTTVKAKEREEEEAERQRRQTAAANAPFWRRGWAGLRLHGPPLLRAAQTLDAVLRVYTRVEVLCRALNLV